MFKKALFILFIAVPAFAGGVKALNIMAEEAIVDYFASKNLEVLSVDTRFSKGSAVVTVSDVAVADKTNDIEYSYLCTNHFVSGFVAWVIVKTECVEN